MARVHLHGGADAPSRAEALDRVFLDGQPAARLLLPTRAAARTRMERLVRGGLVPGFIGRPVLTFEDFAGRLVETAYPSHGRIGPLERRLLLEEILAAQGAANPLRLTRENRGIVVHVERLITQLKQAAVEPGDFRKAVQRQRHKRLLDDAP